MIEVRDMTSEELAASNAVNELKARILKCLLIFNERWYDDDTFCIKRSVLLDVLDGKEPVVEASEAGGDEDSRMDKVTQETER